MVSESEMEILQRTDRSMVRAMCGVNLKDGKRSTDVMFMLGLNETMDQLVMAISVRWYSHVLRGEDGNVLRRALDFEVEGPQNCAHGCGVIGNHQFITSHSKCTLASFDMRLTPWLCPTCLPNTSSIPAPIQPTIAMTTTHIHQL